MSGNMSGAVYAGMQIMPEGHKPLSEQDLLMALMRESVELMMRALAVAEEQKMLLESVLRAIERAPLHRPSMGYRG